MPQPPLLCVGDVPDPQRMPGTTDRIEPGEYCVFLLYTPPLPLTGSAHGFSGHVWIAGVTTLVFWGHR